MRTGRSAGLPAALAAAGVLLAAAAWFLREGEAPVPPPDSAVDPAPVPSHRPAPREGPAPPPPPEEPEDSPPAALPPGVEPWATLRLLDAKSGKPVPADAEPAVLLVSRTRMGQVLLAQHLVPDGKGDWLLASRGEARAPGGKAAGKAGEGDGEDRYEVRALGYATLPDLARGDLEGTRTIHLEPSPPVARGVLEAGAGLAPGRMRCELEPVTLAEPELPPVGGPVLGGRSRLPRSFGPFELQGLAPGTWRLRVRVQQPGGVAAHAEREFEVGEDPADLGTIVLEAPGTIRARVLGADGTGILDPGLRLRRIGGGEDEAVPGEEPDPEGWVEFRGLEPGTAYRVLCSFEGVEETVRTPVSGGGTVRVELLSGVRGVRCRLRFTVMGGEPVKWGAIFEGPTLDPQAWKKDGMLEQEMAPGEYMLGILAQAAGSERMQRYAAKFTVPDQPSFDATIDLKE